MYYNGPGTLGTSGSVTYTAANNYIAGNGSLAIIAEQLAFSANAQTNANESGLEERYLGSALLAMGVIPTYNSQNVITSVDAGGANTQDVVDFLEAAVANPVIGSGGIPAVDYVSKWGLAPLESYNNMVAGLSQYLTTKNYYVPTATDYNPTGSTTLTGNTNPDTYVFTLGDGADTITNFSTLKGDILRFDGGVSLTELLGSENGSALTISYGSGDSIALDNFFLLTSPAVTTTEGGTSVSIYKINMEQGKNHTLQTEAAILVGTNVTMKQASYETSFTVVDGDNSTLVLVGAGTSNTVDLSTATGAVNINLYADTITGGAINDQIYNIQNIIGNFGNDTVTGNNIHFTSQSGTASSPIASVVDGTGDTITLGSHDALTLTSPYGNQNSYTIEASSGADLTTDSINFEGQSIAANNILSGSLSNNGADGLTYTLHDNYGVNFLTVSSPYVKLTLNNFHNGDFGINLVNTGFTQIVPSVLLQNSLNSYTPMSASIDDDGNIFGAYNPEPYNSWDAFGIDKLGNFYDLGALPSTVYPYSDPVGVYDAATGSSNTLANFPQYGQTQNGYVQLNAVNVNNNGVVVGNYETYDGVAHGFVDYGGNISTVDDPNAANAANNVYGGGTYVTSISMLGVIAGNYTDSAGISHGFIDNEGVFTTVDAPAQTGFYNVVTGTYITGVNDMGEVVGDYTYADSVGITHTEAFTYTPSNFSTSISRSYSPVNLPNYINATINGDFNTVTLGSDNHVVLVGNNNTVSGYVSDSITIKGDNNGVTVAPSDPVSIVGGFDNIIDISGSGVVAYDDAASLGNVFSIESTSRGDTITLGAQSDTVSDLGSGNTIILTNSSGNETIYGGTSADTFVIGANVGFNTINNFNQTDTLSFSDPTVTADNLATSRVGNDLVLSTGVTLAGFFDNFTGGSSSLNVSFVGSGASTVSVNSSGQIIPSGGAYLPPVAETDDINANNKGAVSGNVLANNGNGPDTDPNGLALSVQAETLTTKTGGTFTLNADGSFTYTALLGFRGNDSVSYTLEDSSGLSSTGTVNISDIFTDRAPVTQTETINANHKGSVTGNALATDSDPDGDPLSAVPQTIATVNGGTVTISADGSFTYTALLGFRGNDSFTYTAEDSYGLSTVGTVDLNNVFTDRAPITQTETIDANKQGSVTGNVLAVDSDPDGDPLSALPQTITTVNGGTVTISANGQFTYTALLGFRGNDSFTYTAEDPYGLSTVGTVDLNNVFTDRPPVAVNDSFTAAYGQTITGNVLANDSDPDNDPMHVVQSTVTTKDGFTIAMNPDGTFSYTPEAGFLGTDSFTYTVADPYGLTSSATVTLDVTAPPDSIVGTAGNDTLKGTLQDNILFGLDGNDTLIGGPTADTMYGGKGNDTYIVNNANDVIVENPGEGTDTVLSSVSYTLPANVENITLTGHRNINATGNTESNVITGNSGNNILNDGGAGGADTLIGGKGNDTYIVNNSGDKIIEAAHGGFDKVLSSVSYTLSANVEELKLTGTSDINATGNGQGSILIGNSGNNILNDGGPLPSSHGHDDCHDEETGRNIMIGGAGNDTYIVNNKNDIIIEKKNGGTDTVISSVSWSLGENLENLTLSGTANIDARGNCENNVIIGNSGNNIIDGEGGNNTLTGGAGADTFVMQASEAYHGIDTITDFNVQQGDQLKILGIRDFHSFEDHGHHNDCHDSHHATLADYVRITTSGNNSIVSVDANGRGNDFTQIAVLQNVTGLSASALVSSGNMLLQ